MIRLYNAQILSMVPWQDMFDGEVHVDGNKIVYVGPKKEGVFEKEIDCEGNVLMPGFKNAHAHTAMTFVRSVPMRISCVCRSSL